MFCDEIVERIFTLVTYIITLGKYVMFRESQNLIQAGLRFIYL